MTYVTCDVVLALRSDVTVQLVDDLDGSEASETARFGLDGKKYFGDLSQKNGAALRKALKPASIAARRRGVARTTRAGPHRIRPGPPRRDPGVGPCQRLRRRRPQAISREIQDAFDNAHRHPTSGHRNGTLRWAGGINT
jgi:hypothetical protein